MFPVRLKILEPPLTTNQQPLFSPGECLVKTLYYHVLHATYLHARIVSYIPMHCNYFPNNSTPYLYNVFLYNPVILFPFNDSDIHS